MWILGLTFRPSPSSVNQYRTPSGCMRGTQGPMGSLIHRVSVQCTMFTAKCKNSPHEFRGDRLRDVGVNNVFDDDLLLFLVSVDSYHGTQQAFRVRGRSESDSCAMRVTMNGYRRLRHGMRNAWNFWACLMQVLASRCGSRRPTPASRRIPYWRWPRHSSGWP